MGSKVYFPRIRLLQLLMTPGGVSSDEAVAAADANVRSLESEAAVELTERLAEIEQILLVAGATLPPEALTAIQARADQIVSLAASFGHEMLDMRARRLCDSIDQVPP